MAALYTQLEILARDRSDRFQMQKEKKKKKKTGEQTFKHRIASLRRKGRIKGAKMRSPCSSQGEPYMLLELNLSYCIP